MSASTSPLAASNHFATGARYGFTLLEVIIAMTLTSTLLLLVWSLFSTYTKLEERSSRAAVELQLVRSISQQLRSDLEHFAVLPTVVESSSSRATDEANQSEKDNSTSEFSDEQESDTDDSIEQPEPENLESSIEEPSGSFEQPSAVGLAISVDTDFTKDDFYRNSFDSSLPTLTYLRGNKTRLEFVTRLPYTVDVPVPGQRLGAETKYGTHLLVWYEFRDPRNLETLLKEDPILNPQRWNPPKPVNPNDPIPVAKPMNPNDNVGLIREVKSWLHVTRDRRRDELKKQADAAGLLVNGELPALDPRFANQAQASIPERAAQRTYAQGEPDSLMSGWQPPPEFRHKRDNMPEVTKLQFRYLSGDSWLLEWNQVDKLPRAIEVAFDLDSEAPVQRAKEFEAAHAAVLGGQSVQQVLTPQELNEDLVDEELLTGLDALSTMDLTDPTAIVTEYRFVILLPNDPGADDESEADEGSQSTDAISMTDSAEEDA